MELWLISIIAGISIGIFFFLISKLGKQEDYLLDDYTEEESPDNVRVIEREVPKIIEKEVIIEVEKLIQDDSEIKRLNLELESLKEKISISNIDIELLTTQKTELNDQISNKDSEKSKLESEILIKDSQIEKVNKIIEETEFNFDSYKKETTEKYTNVNTKYNQIIEERDILVGEKDSLVSEKESLTIEKEYLSEENKLSKRYLEETKDEKDEIVSRLNKDKNNLKDKLEKVEENRKEYQSLFQKSKEKVDRALKDRDHFIGLVDQKDIELSKIKKEIISNPHVYEGRDEYGKFNDVYNLSGEEYTSTIIDKIQQINDELESGQFGYYVINTMSNTENLQINDISSLDKFLKRVNKPKTRGKYKIYLIFSNKVYPFIIH